MLFHARIVQGMLLRAAPDTCPPQAILAEAMPPVVAAPQAAAFPELPG